MYGNRIIYSRKEKSLFFNNCHYEEGHKMTTKFSNKFVLSEALSILKMKNVHPEYFDNTKKYNKNLLWIVKPVNSSRGEGILLPCNTKKIYEGNYNNNSKYIVQRYINPKLIDGYKFDFRSFLFFINNCIFAVQN